MILEKICKQCGQMKSIDDYYSNGKRKNARCKLCICKNVSEHVSKNREAINERQRQNYAKIKDTPEQKQKRKLEYAKKIEENPNYCKGYYETHKVRINIQNAKWSKENKDKSNAYKYRWAQENPERNRKNKNDWQNKKLNTDIQHKIACNLRHRLYMSLTGRTKIGSAIDDLGCSVDELRMHLESLFYSNPETGEEMTWENYGSKWEIDHRRPMSWFDLENALDVKKVCHYSNLKPMWGSENRAKRNKYED